MQHHVSDELPQYSCMLMLHLELLPQLLNIMQCLEDHIKCAVILLLALYDCEVEFNAGIL